MPVIILFAIILLLSQSQLKEEIMLNRILKNKWDGSDEKNSFSNYYNFKWNF